MMSAHNRSVRRLVPCACLIPAVLLLTGCMSTGDGGGASRWDVSDHVVVEDPREECFNVRDVRDFDYIDDYHVLVEARLDQHYLLTLERVCFGLMNANSLAIEHTTNRICSNVRATLTFEDFQISKRCVISTVEWVESKATAVKVVQNRSLTNKKRDR